MELLDHLKSQLSTTFCGTESHYWEVSSSWPRMKLSYDAGFCRRVYLCFPHVPRRLGSPATGYDDIKFVQQTDEQPGCG